MLVLASATALVASATALVASPLRPAVARPQRVHSAPRASVVDPFAGADLDLDAIRKAQESMLEKEAEKQAAEDAAEQAAAWRALEETLPPLSESAAPVLTLYRDTNGWCPFCERVWLQLHAKGIPFREELVDLRDKPEWYKEMVPTALVPAVKYDSDGAITWESVDVMLQIEERFPDAPPLLPAEADSEARARAERMMAGCADVLGAGVRMSYGNANATEADRAAAQANFTAQLDKLDAEVAEGGGPFMHGAAFTLVDAMYIPMMERWAAQLPITTGIVLRPAEGEEPRWPALAGWLAAMETQLPAYADYVMGDVYSWSALVGTFQRMFSGNVTEPGRLAAIKATTLKADMAANRELVAAREAPLDSHRLVHRHAAARALLSNRDNVLADAVNAAPKSQPQLRRLVEEEGMPRNEPTLAKGLREVCRRLLDQPDEGVMDLAYADVPAEAAVVARGCMPRDMGAASAAAARTALLQLAAEAELYAWKSSGGLL